MGGSCAQAPETRLRSPCDSLVRQRPCDNGCDPGEEGTVCRLLQADGCARGCEQEQAAARRTADRRRHVSLLHDPRPTRFPGEESAQHRAVM